MKSTFKPVRRADSALANSTPSHPRHCDISQEQTGSGEQSVRPWRSLPVHFRREDSVASALKDLLGELAEWL